MVMETRQANFTDALKVAWSAFWRAVVLSIVAALVLMALVFLGGVLFSVFAAHDSNSAMSVIDFFMGRSLANPFLYVLGLAIMYLVNFAAIEMTTKVKYSDFEFCSQITRKDVAMVTLMFSVLGIILDMFYHVMGVTGSLFIPAVVGFFSWVFFFQYMMNKGLFGYRLPAFDSKGKASAPKSAAMLVSSVSKPKATTSKSKAKTTTSKAKATKSASSVSKPKATTSKAKTKATASKSKVTKSTSSVSKPKAATSKAKPKTTASKAKSKMSTKGKPKK